MKKCAICHKKRVFHILYYFCSKCYNKYKGEKWFKGFKKLVKHQEYRDRIENAHTIGFEDTVLTKEGREKVKDIWQKQVEREYADEQAKERQSV